MDKEGMLQPYAPRAWTRSPPTCVTPRPSPPGSAWTARRRHLLQHRRGRKQKLPKPTSWQDLTKPVYAGKIVMPNPASSGTGFLDVSAWLQIFGEEKGWAYMDALHKNIGSYTHSGSKPCNLAARASSRSASRSTTAPPS